MKSKKPKLWTAAEMGRKGGKAKTKKPKGFAAITKHELHKIVAKSVAARRKKLAPETP